MGGRVGQRLIGASKGRPPSTRACGRRSGPCPTRGEKKTRLHEPWCRRRQEKRKTGLRVGAAPSFTSGNRRRGPEAFEQMIRVDDRRIDGGRGRRISKWSKHSSAVAFFDRLVAAPARGPSADLQFLDRAQSRGERSSSPRAKLFRTAGARPTVGRRASSDRQGKKVGMPWSGPNPRSGPMRGESADRERARRSCASN